MAQVNDIRAKTVRAALSAPEKERPLLAVVDVGSNSVRLVIYDAASRAPTARFNEKVLCGLGRGMAETGALNPDGVQSALATLQRFVALSRSMGVQQTVIVATAAAREATNGPAFLAEVERLTGQSVLLLSGADEARYSALGVLSGMPDAHGLMGDLGGGSLELVGLADGRSGQDAVTLPLGPLRLMHLDGEGVRKKMDQAYDAVAWLKRYSGKPLYAVGGAWRSLARIHMAMAGYPLHIIHHYSIKPDDLDEVQRFMAKNRDALARVPGLSRRRIDTLPLAAQVLRRLVKAYNPGALVFSAYGLREGLHYENLPAAQREQDPLWAAAERRCQRDGRFPEQIGFIGAFIAPLFDGESAADARLRHTAVLLSDIAWDIHPDYRADEAFTHILHAPFAAITHGERVRLALALYVRYGGEPDSLPLTKPFLGLIAEKDRKWAMRLGAALRLAHTISGGAGQILKDFTLAPDAKNLVLATPGANAALAGESVTRRLGALAKTMGLEPRVDLV